MLTEIGDSIQVQAVFDGGGLRPVSFTWGGRDYLIDEITGRWKAAQGRAVLLCFAVVCGADVFELVLNTGNMRWTLARADVEG